MTHPWRMALGASTLALLATAGLLPSGTAQEKPKAATARPKDAPAAKSADVELDECRILLMDAVTLASDRNGVLSRTVPEEGDVVKAESVIVTLRDDVPAAALAVANAKAENDVEVRYSIAAADVAQAEHEKAEQANVKLKGTVPEVEVGRLLLAAKRSRLQIEQADLQMKVHALERDQARAELASYSVVAPFDGTVTKVYRHRGEAVRQGDPIVDVTSTKRVRVEGDVPLNQSWNLKPGQEVSVRLSAPGLPKEIADQTFPGKLVFVDVTSQPVSGKTRVWAVVQNHDNILRAGLSARMRILKDAPKTTEPPRTSAQVDDAPLPGPAPRSVGPSLTR